MTLPSFLPGVAARAEGRGTCGRDDRSGERRAPGQIYTWPPSATTPAGGARRPCHGAGRSAGLWGQGHLLPPRGIEMLDWLRRRRLSAEAKRKLLIVAARSEEAVIETHVSNVLDMLDMLGDEI